MSFSRREMTLRRARFFSSERYDEPRSPWRIGCREHLVPGTPSGPSATASNASVHHRCGIPVGGSAPPHSPRATISKERCKRLQKALHPFVGAETHHSFDTARSAPASVEDNNLPHRWKVRKIPLDIHLRLLALGRRRQRIDAEYASRHRNDHAVHFAANRAHIAGYDRPNPSAPLAGGGRVRSRH